MTEIHEHANAVHLVNERISEFAEAAPAWLDRRQIPARVGECVVTHVRKCNVAYTKIVICSEDLDRVSELVPATKARISECKRALNLLMTCPSTPSKDAILPSLMASLTFWEVAAFANVFGQDGIRTTRTGRLVNAKGGSH